MLCLAILPVFKPEKTELWTSKDGFLRFGAYRPAIDGFRPLCTASGDDGGVAVLGTSGIISADQALAEFSNSGLITVVAMFVVATGLFIIPAVSVCWLTICFAIPNRSVLPASS